jgi:hypothetical protein
MITLDALSLAPAARRWLSQTTSARVLNSFDRACNLINQDGDILALVASERGLTPFGVVVASEDRAPFRTASAASPVRVEATRLTIGDLQIEFESAGMWNPTPNWVEVRRLFAGDIELLEALAMMALEVAPRGSLLELFLPAEARTMNSLMVKRALVGALELVSGLRMGSVEKSVAGANKLAGLGGGLTPAGDDFIVGVLLAGWAGLYGEGRERLGAAIVEAAAPATTLLSAAYLKSAARGECTAHWHELFDSLLRPDAEAARGAIRSLMSVGHTSGADAFAGFAFHHFTNAASKATMFSPSASLL